MAENSGIEWTKHTANLWHGCTKVSEGCDHCYAETIAKRWGHNVWGNDNPRKQIKSFKADLLKYQRAAKCINTIDRVFVGSMMDIFEKPMPLVDSKGNRLAINTGDLRKDFFENISKGMYPNLMFLFLTKRPSNINKYIPEAWKQSPPANIMFGTSPCNQLTAMTLIDQLLKVKGSKFLSVEPQLSEITLKPWLESGQIDWVIQGGESGPGKRPFETDWARKLKAECEETGTAYFFKQIDQVKAIPKDLAIREYPEDVFSIGLKAACNGCPKPKIILGRGFQL
jgi:protein gp37